MKTISNPIYELILWLLAAFLLGAVTTTCAMLILESAFEKLY